MSPSVTDFETSCTYVVPSLRENHQIWRSIRDWRFFILLASGDDEPYFCYWNPREKEKNNAEDFQARLEFPGTIHLAIWRSMLLVSSFPCTHTTFIFVSLKQQVTMSSQGFSNTFNWSSQYASFQSQQTGQTPGAPSVPSPVDDVRKRTWSEESAASVSSTPSQDGSNKRTKRTRSDDDCPPASFRPRYSYSS